MKSRALLISLALTFGCKVSQNPGYSKSEVFLEDGVASWYGPGFHGKTTANGEKFDTNKPTAAHRTLPFGTMIRVANSTNGKSVVVRINDRGPYSKNRIIDLSQAAAKEIDMIEQGTAMVSLYLLGQEKEEIKVDDLKKPSFTVQIGSFSDQGEAFQKASEFEDGWIKKAKVKGKFVYRVYLGKFTSAEAARKRKNSFSTSTGFVKQIEN
ncbi:septal ring lytic transglycosylase RlpA family protein [Ekhidna sp.]|uniref:septal ring lytic transglycosylase RlpA family protein n=1 Tax=Ekhidna sp. TaxID=2608089 RepID=UPI003513E9C7